MKLITHFFLVLSLVTVSFGRIPRQSEMALSSPKVGIMTFYYMGFTSCGLVYSNSDRGAAIGTSNYFNSQNRNTGSACGRKIRITDPVSGKSVVAVVRDHCLSCKQNNIDVSTSVFKIFKPLSAGRLSVEWDFI